MFIIIGRGFERWFIDTMYHAVKQFLNFGHLRQLIVIVWAADVRAVTYTKSILQTVFPNAK